MKNTNKFLLLVFCLALLMMTTASSVMADNKCLNAAGSAYPDSAPGSSPCYICIDSICKPTGKTLSHYRGTSSTAPLDPAPFRPQPVAEQPVYQQPVAEQPVRQEPAAGQPVSQEPVTDQPVIQQPVTEQPVYHQEPVAEQPVYQQPVIEQPVYQEPAAEQPVYQQPVIEQPVYQEPVAEQPVYQQPIVIQPVYQEPAAEQPVYQQPVAEQPDPDFYQERGESSYYYTEPVYSISESEDQTDLYTGAAEIIVPVFNPPADPAMTGRPEEPAEVIVPIMVISSGEPETGPDFSDTDDFRGDTERADIPTFKQEGPETTPTSVPSDYYGETEEPGSGTDIIPEIGWIDSGVAEITVPEITDPDVTETPTPEVIGPDDETTPGEGGANPDVTETPTSEDTDPNTETTPEVSETDPNLTETPTPEDTDPNAETTPEVGETDSPALISIRAYEELSALFTEEELAELLADLSEETLDGLTGMVSDETLAELYGLLPTETTPPDQETTPTSGTGEIPFDIVKLVSKEARKELSALFSAEELIDLFANLSEEKLEELSGLLSEATLNELYAVLSDMELSQGEQTLLESVPIEGTLNEIKLSSPNDDIVETSAVSFIWVYDYTEGSASVNVDFTLSLSIDDLDHGTHTTLSTTVNSASCANYICGYTAGTELSAYENALVTWTVSGTYGTTTVNASNGPLSFILMSKPTPPPHPKPEAPVLECPKGRYIKRELGFYWAPSKYAESYTVNWWNDKGQSGSMSLSNGDPTCQAGRCIVHAKMPGEGNYAWTVTARNASGKAKSKEMHFEIASNISTPSTHSPSGTIYNNQYIAFEWTDVEDGAVEYHVQVVGKYDNRFYMDRWFRVKDIYVGRGICYVQTDLYLPAGSYSWRVQARNNSFSSGWSEWRDFYVQSYNYSYSYTNTIPSTLYPTGTITILNPQFQWRTLTGASYYMVKLTDSKGVILFDRQVSASGTCGSETCTWNPNYTLPGNGSYSWTVSGYGSNGGFWGTASGSFTVQAEIKLNPMSFLSPVPNGYLNPESPLVIWTDPGEAAVMFTVEIYGPNKNLLLNANLNREQAWCDGISCTIQFQSIPDGENYRIAVTPYTELNTKGQTIELVFNKGGQTVLLNSPKEGSTVSSRPMFRWNLDAGTDLRYELILTDANNNVMTFSPLVCGAVGVNCEDGEAYFSPADPIPAGNYSGKIAISGTPTAGAEVHFTVK